MKFAAFLNSFEKELDLKKGTFNLKKKLKHIPEWDSLAVMTFISFSSKKLKRDINPNDLNKCNYVEDLGKLLKLKN